MSPLALLQKLDDGDISNIVPEVKAALAGSGHSSLAHRVLSRTSIIYRKSSGTPVITDDNVALELVLCCCQAIDVDGAGKGNINDSRTIASVYNILLTLYGNGNTKCVAKILEVFLPLVEKMLPTMKARELTAIEKLVVLTKTLVISASDNMYKEDPSCELSPLDLWALMLRVSSLVSPEKSITCIFTVMKTMLIKYENCHSSSGAKINAFKKAVLDQFLHNSETKLPKLAQEDSVDAVFSSLVATFWQLLRIDIKFGNVSNSHDTISLMSKFVSSFLCDHSCHLEYFNIAVRILKAFWFEANHLPDQKLFTSELQSLVQILETKKKAPSFEWVLFIGGCAVTSIDKEHTANTTVQEFFTSEVLSSIHYFTKSLAELLVFCNTSSCQSANGEACPFKGDARLAFRTVNYFIYLSVEYMKENRDGSESMLPLIQDSLSVLQSILDQASKGKCVQTHMLKENLHDLYNRVGNMCYHRNYWDHGQMFLMYPIKHWYTLEKDISSIQQQKVLSALSRLSVCYEKQGLMKEAKSAVLLHVLMHLKCNIPQRPFLRDQWSLLQNADPSKAMTADLFLTRESFLLKSMCSEFNINPQDIPHVLLWELSCYISHKMKSTEIILNAWLALKATNPPSHMLLEGSAMACKALFSSNDTVDWHDLMSVSLTSWLSQVSNADKAVSLCSMAVHYKMKFLIMAQKHFCENESKVEEASIYSQKPSAVRQPQDVINPTDVCEVRSTFPNLNLPREQKLMDLLDSAVNYWSDSLEAGLATQHHTMHSVVASSGEYLLEIGFLFTLWGFTSGAAKAFTVCHQFAKKMALPDISLQALSGLMNTIEVKQEYITEADALLNQLKDHHKISYLRQVYLTSRAFQALRTSAYSEGVNILQDVVNYTPHLSTLWCYVYGKLLQAAYSLLPKSMLEKTQLGGHSSAYVGLMYSLKNIQDRRLNDSPLMFAAIVNFALSISLWIGRYYLRRQMPREARLMLKPELMLALKLGLATRAAEFICELAFVDLLTENVDGAAAKIADLQGILGNSDIDATNDQTNGKSLEEDYVFNPKDPILRPKICALGSSPILHEKFSIPITQHGTTCKCYMCRNCSVQNIWLIYGHLQAKVNILNFNVHNSFEIYKKTINAAELVLHKLGQESCSPGFLLQHHEVACTEICLRLDLVDMLVMYGKDEVAWGRNKRIIEALNNLKTFENQLSAEAQEQKMCIVKIMEQQQHKTSGLRVPKTPPINSSPQSPASFVEKTPEQSVCVATPINIGKKRQPLKPVKTSNRLTVPSVDGQFYTPKASVDIGHILNSDDEEINGQPSKEYMSSSRGMFSGSPRKTSVKSGFSKSTCTTEKTEVKAEDVKKIPGSKVVKSCRTSKATTGMSSIPLNEKPAAPKKVANIRTGTANMATSDKTSSLKKTTNMKTTSSTLIGDKPVTIQKAGGTRAAVTTTARQPSTSSITKTSTSTKPSSSCSDVKAAKADHEGCLKARTSSRVNPDTSGKILRQTRQRKN